MRQPISIPELPESDRVRTALARYAPIVLPVEEGLLRPGDRQALDILAEACRWIDHLYLRQRSAIGTQLTLHLEGREDERSAELKRLLAINFGPWDTLEGDRPFWGKTPRPPGGSLYPDDLTREELDRYVRDHPGERDLLLSPTTLVRRRDRGLLAIPYHEAYRDELAEVARCLTDASVVASHPGFRAFLRARARDLQSGDLRDSERLWVALTGSPIDIAIGPYEVYDDGLLGLKTAYEATVLVRHPLSDRLAEFEKLMPQLEAALPGAVAADPSQRRVAIGVFDLWRSAGMTNMGVKAVAAMLPNDERVRHEAGARLLLFNNVIAAKFQAVLRPLSDRVLAPAAADLVCEEAFVLQTLLHEAAHALSSGFVVRDGAPTAQTINQALRDRYSTIEEGRADLVGLAYLTVLVRSGMVAAGLGPAAYATYVANCVRSLRFGLRSDYSRAAAVALNTLLETGGITPRDGRLDVDVETVGRTTRELGTRIQAIATGGDYRAAEELVGRLAHVPGAIAPLLSSLADLPVDLEFVFDGSAPVRS